jgi:hypothetical protein
MKTRRIYIVFRIATALFLLPQLWSAVQYFTEAPEMVATMIHLGYPIYFTKILGVAKVLGAVGLVQRRYPRLTEWAFAGFTFELIGAIVSHLASGDPVVVALVPLAFLAVLIVAYAAWRVPRRRARA